MSRLHRVYLTPGMFGFGKIGSYDYFAHVVRALTARFRAAGEELHTFVADVAPTASIRRRAMSLATLIGNTASDDDGPIHLFGHSTGGLDARLVASPSATLSNSPDPRHWLSRLSSVTTMSTPHLGTPLASFFATVSGQRMLYAISALTVTGLSLGAPPLAAASAVVMAISRMDHALGVELRILDRTTGALLKALEPAMSSEVERYLDAIRRDQGAVIQLTPEAMDLFIAGVEDRPGVTYQCACAMAPPPSLTRIARSLPSPWRALSSILFTTMFGLTSRFDEKYPCAAPNMSEETMQTLAHAFDRMPSARANDGVVPLLSQIWGRVVWAGYGDHLDVIGHFAGSKHATPPAAERHIDWLMSCSNFNEHAFESLMDAVASGMLESVQ